MKHLGNALGYSFIGEVFTSFQVITRAIASACYWHANFA